PRGASMAGALTAEANDYTAVFYNPARLVLRKDVNFGFSFQWYRTNATVESVDLARDIHEGSRCAYCTPPDAVGFSFGLLFPLAGKVQNRVAIGLGLFIPSQVL